MVMNNLPPLRKPLPYQREHAANVSLVSLQMPAPQHQRRIRPKEPELQLREIELSHRRPVRIILLVARHHAIPPARDSVAPGKRQLRRMPVAHQERVHVSAIPSSLLRVQHRCYRSLVRVAPLSSFRLPPDSHAQRKQQHQCRNQSNALSHQCSPQQNAHSSRTGPESTIGRRKVCHMLATLDQHQTCSLVTIEDDHQWTLPNEEYLTVFNARVLVATSRVLRGIGGPQKITESIPQLLSRLAYHQLDATTTVADHRAGGHIEIHSVTARFPENILDILGVTVRVGQDPRGDKKQIQQQKRQSESAQFVASLVAPNVRSLHRACHAFGWPQRRTAMSMVRTYIGEYHWSEDALCGAEWRNGRGISSPADCAASCGVAAPGRDARKNGAEPRARRGSGCVSRVGHHNCDLRARSARLATKSAGNSNRELFRVPVADCPAHSIFPPRRTTI